MGMPTTTLEVAFTTDPGATPTWTDVTAYLKNFKVHRGRPDEKAAYSPGQVEIVLANEDRRFDSQYAAGPYYPNVVPMRRIRIRAVYSAVTYDIFNGYVTNWQQQYSPPQDAECVLEATDAFKVLANTTLLSSAYAEEVDTDSPTLWFRLGDTAAANVAVDQIAGVRQLSPLGSPSFGASSLAINDPDGAVAFPTGNDGLQGVFPEGTFPFTTAGTIEFLYRKNSGSGNDQLMAIAALGSTISGVQSDTSGTAGGANFQLLNNAGGTFTVGTAGGLINDLATHHIMLTWAAGSPIKIYVDGVDRTAAAVNFTGSMANTTDKWIAFLNRVDYPPIVVTGGVGTYDELAVYTSQVSAARATAHYNAGITAWRGDRSGARIGRILDAVGWPAADRSIDTGLAVLQSATLGTTVLDALQRIEETEQGRLFVTADGKVRFIARDSMLKTPYTTSQATFGDSGSELEFGDLTYDDSDNSIVNEAQVSRNNGVVQIVRDTTSQTRYLRRTLVLSGLEHQDDSTSRDLANWVVQHYKDPFRRATGLRLEPSAGNEATHFPQVLGRELADRVTVKRIPQNLGAAINQDVNIEGIGHTVSADQWVTTWDLSPAEAQVYWILGVAGFSELGVTTRLGF